MPTTRKRIPFLLEGNEEELLQSLADEEGVSKSRTIGLLVRRAAKEKIIESATITRNQALIKALADISQETDSSKMIEIAKESLAILRYQQATTHHD